MRRFLKSSSGSLCAQKTSPTPSQSEIHKRGVQIPTNTMSATDQMLTRLFARHFDDPVAALKRLEKYFAAIPQPFDLHAQLRELAYPAQPGLPEGLPSLIYYFLPK